MNRSALAIGLAAALAAGLATGGCSPGDGGGESAAAPRIYEARGLVRRVPGPRELLVHHEPIHDFAGIDGEVVGMDSMTMPFAVADEIDLSDIAPGDKIAFRLEVSWGGEVPTRIIALEEIPADTELVYGEAEPPSP